MISAAVLANVTRISHGSISIGDRIQFTAPADPLIQRCVAPRGGLSTRLPKTEVEAVESAAETAGMTCAEWLREPGLVDDDKPTLSLPILPIITSQG
jgi:hypothetical protein